ncbi:MAG: sigma-54-dependent Fis family transcriptional regulator [Deltaproteobacteria bacterium]|nr:sigma-54-dependent Fis family transcriptional regulator [Deltaproteobacteria bacterium]MCB9487237.1 sigma-54-dependent Fis family transcriptional regulator [Deltaproteobacteria bacterium]
MATTILVVDDERESAQMLSRFFEASGYEVLSASEGVEALRLAKENRVDLMITDLKMPRMDGITLLKEMQTVSPQTVGIVVTGFATVDTAVEAMKVGAFDYVSKPFQLEEIRLAVQRALDHRRLKEENVSLKQQLRKKYRFENIVGDHPKMQELFRLIERVANSDSTVLVTGDSGTGKELVARAIHYNSNRREKYLVPVNCGAIPENLLESELFGYVKGAFTGATATREGRFETANGGTIFLDEIGEMSMNLQVKLLRVIQESEFEPVGSSKTRRVDVRIIAATNINLEQAVKERQFREDLFYRLNVIPLHIPPLRERRSDIPLLVNHFLSHFREEKNRDVQPLDDDVMAALMAYDWPGNVRELENLIERMVILSDDGHIRMNDLPEKLREAQGIPAPTHVVIPEGGLEFNKVIGDYEDRLILSALERTKGNKNLAAKLLNLKRTTLVEKIKKKGLDEVIAEKMAG